MLYFITVLHFLSSGLELCLECAVCSRPVPLAADRDKLGILQDDRDARTVRNSETDWVLILRDLPRDLTSAKIVDRKNFMIFMPCNCSRVA